MTFEERLPVIYREIAKRKAKHVLSTLAWEDVVQMLSLRIFQKYHLYDPQKSEFTHWCNTVISNAIKNILRQNLTKWSRPCILGCAYNLGDDFCGYTKSGRQCEECPLYASWKKKKYDHFAVQQVLALDNHAQEVNSIQNDFLDIEEKKKIIDIKIQEKLTRQEYKIYQLIYVNNYSEEEAGAILKYKKGKNSSIPGYQIISKAKKKFIKVTKEIIEEESLA
jgi:RNA polymerase sigma factor (sigma-70 family)